MIQSYNLILNHHFNDEIKNGRFFYSAKKH